MKCPRTGLRVTRPLTDGEVEAIRWARRSYRPNWKMRLRTTLREHMAILRPLPRHYPRASQIKHRLWWRRFFYAPYGHAEMNTLHHIARNLIRDGVVR